MHWSFIHACIFRFAFVFVYFFQVLLFSTCIPVTFRIILGTLRMSMRGYCHLSGGVPNMSILTWFQNIFATFGIILGKSMDADERIFSLPWNYPGEIYGCRWEDIFTQPWNYLGAVYECWWEDIFTTLNVSWGTLRISVGGYFHLFGRVLDISILAEFHNVLTSPKFILGTLRRQREDIFTNLGFILGHSTEASERIFS